MATKTSTPRLTAQQKRDREFMQLLDDSLAKQARVHEMELAKFGNENFSLGYEQGEQRAAYEFSRLSVWQRIWFRP